MILVPEIPYDLDVVTESLVARFRRGRRFSIVVVAEGAKPVGGTESIIGESEGGSE